MVDRVDSVMIVHCRARVSVDCENGEEPYYDQEEDGTWNGESVICDPCYIKLMPYTPSGRALLDEIDEALEEIRQTGA